MKQQWLGIHPVTSQPLETDQLPMAIHMEVSCKSQPLVSWVYSKYIKSSHQKKSRKVHPLLKIREASPFLQLLLKDLFGACCVSGYIKIVH